jgi:hypothetical protein
MKLPVAFEKVFILTYLNAITTTSDFYLPVASIYALLITEEIHIASAPRFWGSFVPRMSQVSDLIKDSKLHTKFESELITPTFLESTTIAGRRGRRRERNEVWKRKRHLGIGIFGTVWLEECVSEGKLRAVKEVRKSVPSLESIDFNRELEAIARFSQQKVSSL